ncbi:MAG: D-glycero-beta-D-manno-heptose 1-phosphate adenylyltransferase [Cyanobacteriota bacterium ELA615]
MTQIYNLDQLNQLVKQDPQKWRPLVFTNGCFDLLHVGHIRYLQTAKSLGNKLIVGVNSDHSINQIKPNKGRPIIPEQQRLEVLGSLRSVDAVVLFSQKTADHLLKVLEPDIYVKGGDYDIQTLPEANTVQEYGGKIELIKIEIPTSTSKIIEKIRNTCL